MRILRCPKSFNKLVFISFFTWMGLISYTFIQLNNSLFRVVPFTKPCSNGSTSISALGQISSITDWNGTSFSGPKAMTAHIHVYYNLTIVSAFIDIGSFRSGLFSKQRDHGIYERWASAYSLLYTPFVFYTNSKMFGSYMQNQVRNHVTNLTRIVYVDHCSLWAFQQRDKVSAVYQSQGYPKFWPNTVSPDYTCVMHAKFDFLQDALDRQYFPSHHIAWMDIGYLRDLTPLSRQDIDVTLEMYVMLPPFDFDPKRVMFGQVDQLLFHTPWKKIFHKNINWVAGGFFLAKTQTMQQFVQQYRRAVSLFLEQHESQVDQQVIHAMYTQEGRDLVQPTLEIQPVLNADWFDAGLRCLSRVKRTHAPSLLLRTTS